MTQFLTPNCSILNYMPFPRFLLDKTDLSDSAKILYIILLDRAKLSQKNEGWSDEQGRVYIFYTIKKMAEAMHKSEMSVKTALKALEREELIVRKHQGVGLPNKIYVKVPTEFLTKEDRYLSVCQTENCPTEGKKTIRKTDRNASGNKKNSNIRKLNRGSKEELRTAYGIYQNVFLSEEELSLLRNDVPNYREYIEKLSSYMESSGKFYSNHAATIRCWALRDQPASSKRSYECKEDESL